MIGTTGSLAANIATAAPSTISRIIAGWPALALLIAVKLLTGMLNHSDTAPSRPHSSKDDHDELSRRLAANSGHPNPAALHRSAKSSSNQQTAQQHASRPPAAAASAAVPAPGIADLLPAARAARDDLHSAGELLTRDALAARLRQTGHPIRNSRLTELLHELRSEETTPPSAPPTDKAA